METEFYEKNERKYRCTPCDFICSYLSDWNRHVHTRKHNVSVGGTKMETFGNKMSMPILQSHACKKCNKMYTTKSGLWKHAQKCPDKEEETDITLIQTVIKQNEELKNMITEIIKNGVTNVSHTTNNNNNTHFNLSIFLNDTCKDAINISEFIKTITPKLTDLENVGKNGYIPGITNIIINHINLLDQSKRPIHCTDVKREVLYVKDEDKWEKEQEGKPKIRKMIQKVTNKTINLIPTFQKTYPDHSNSESITSDKYQQIIFESMGGEGDNETEKENLMIKIISKEVAIKKKIIENLTNPK